MKLATIGIFGSIFAIGSADILSSPAAIQCGALTILGGAVLYLLKYTIPALLKSQESELKRHLEAEERSRKDFTDCIVAVTSEARRSAGP